MYQVFRRMKDIVNTDDIPEIMERVEDLFRLIKDVENALDSTKGWVDRNLDCREF